MPCEPSPEYNFVGCIERSIIARAGCQPQWRRFTVEGQPLCDNSSLLYKYSQEYTKFMKLDRDQLFAASNCMMPCSFMEYKVSADVGLYVGVDIYVDTFYVDCRYFSLLIIHIPIVYDRSQKSQQQFQIMTQR